MHVQNRFLIPQRSEIPIWLQRELFCSDKGFETMEMFFMNV
jgi:hypothetical protein